MRFTLLAAWLTVAVALGAQSPGFAYRGMWVGMPRSALMTRLAGSEPGSSACGRLAKTRYEVCQAHDGTLDGDAKYERIFAVIDAPSSQVLAVEVTRILPSPENATIWMRSLVSIWGKPTEVMREQLAAAWERGHTLAMFKIEPSGTGDRFKISLLDIRRMNDLGDILAADSSMAPQLQINP